MHRKMTIYLEFGANKALLDILSRSLIYHFSFFLTSLIACNGDSGNTLIEILWGAGTYIALNKNLEVTIESITKTRNNITQVSLCDIPKVLKLL